MATKAKYCSCRLSTLFVGIFFCCIDTTKADSIKMLGEARAMAFIVFRLDVDECKPNEVVSLEVQGPQGTLSALRLLASDLEEIPGTAFAESTDKKCSLIIPAFTSQEKSLAGLRHVFEVEGKYHVKMRRSRINQDSRDLVAEVTASYIFTQAARVDWDYFRAVQARASMLFGISKDEAVALVSQPGLGLAQSIIDSILRQGDPTHGKSEWIDALRGIEHAAPGSSYAPYVSYYLACSLLWQRKEGFLRREYDIEIPDARVTNLDFYREAEGALRNAVEEGDEFLRPIAITYFAWVKAWGEDFVEAKRLAAEARDLRGSLRQMPDIIADVEKGISKLESRAQRKNSP